MDTLAILVAAGRGERMGGGRPKAFLELGGVPLLMRSARAFDGAAGIDAMVVVVPAAEVVGAQEMLRPLRKVVAIVAGGERRQDSVLLGMNWAPKAFEGIVLVHDAARPFVSARLIEAVIAEARHSGAAVPVWAVTDTVKRVRDGRVLETVDRAELAAAQTPQAFRFSILARAYQESLKDQVTVTDEAMAVERLGISVRTVAGEPGNRKLTTPDDLVWAEAVLAAQAGA